MAVSDKNSFRQKLMLVSDGLSEGDLLHLINLCRESKETLTRKEADSISTGYELFELLEGRGKLSTNYFWYLADLLLAIDQNALLEHIGLGNLPELENDRHRRCQLNPYRMFLTKLAMEMDDKDFHALKSACNCCKEEITHFYHLVMFLENHGKIGPKHGIQELVVAFEKAQLLTERNSKISAIIESFKVQLDNEEDHYRMTSKPRGICVIINNVDFQMKKEKREGSDKDANRLSRLFTQFSFEVELLSNLTSKTIVEKLQEISQRDHWLYDCFVCCVLSHGSLGSVFGVDGKTVRIQRLLDMFSISNCPSLKDKPKVFFFQACQGEKFQQARVPSGATGSQTRSDAFIDDEAPPQSQFGPDLLLGYATTPGHKSFRSPTHGSWYIQELVDCLKKYAAQEDILTILTKVNNDVGEKVGVENDCQVRQIPRPTFTLNKKLFLNWEDKSC